MSLVTSERGQPLLSLSRYTLSREDTQAPARAAVVAPQPCPQLCHHHGPWHPLEITSTPLPEMGVGFACHSEQEAGATSLQAPQHTRVTPTSNASMPVGVHKSFPADFSSSSKTKILLNTDWLEQERCKWWGFFTNILALGLDIPKFLSNCEIPAAMTADRAVCLAH